MFRQSDRNSASAEFQHIAVADRWNLHQMLGTRLHKNMLPETIGQWHSLKHKRDLTSMKVRPQGRAGHAELLYWIIHIVLILINPLCLANFSHRASFLKNCNYQGQHPGHVGCSVSCRQELCSVKAFSPINRSLPHCKLKTRDLCTEMAISSHSSQAERLRWKEGGSVR